MSDGEASMNYKTIQRLGFVKGLYRASYVNLCLAGSVRVPFREYMKEEDVQRYVVLLKECQYKLEELSDMLDVVDDRMRERLDVWKEERE